MCVHGTCDKVLPDDDNAGVMYDGESIFFKILRVYFFCNLNDSLIIELKWIRRHLL